MKHNKIKNTGLIFEILSRLVMRETLDNKNTALSIVKRHFKSGSELVKELSLYQNLTNSTKHNPVELFEMSIKSHKAIDKKVLSEQRYNLIKDIKKNYNLQIFFQTKTNNYKITASVYKLFEYNDLDDPNDYLSCKQLVIECLSGNKEIIDTGVENILREQDKDTRILSFKIYVDKFNNKYKSLNSKQQLLLKRYLNEDTNDHLFKDYIIAEANSISKQLNKLKSNVVNEITKIKLTETINLIENIINSKTIKSEHLSALLKYYELIDELK